MVLSLQALVNKKEKKKEKRKEKKETTIEAIFLITWPLSLSSTTSLLLVTHYLTLALSSDRT